jgi:glycosyltransferase involved in cell wall biosynthesis
VRILIATPEFPPHAGGGITRFYATLAPALAAQGCTVQVIVAAPFSDDFDGYQRDGVTVHCVPQARMRARARALAQFSAASTYRRWLGAAWAAADLAVELGPFDAVEVTDFGLTFVPFVLEPVAPTLVQCHGSLGQISEHEPRAAELDLDFALSRVTEATLLPLADGLQTYGSPNAAEWSARLGRSVDVVPPPLDAEAAPNGRGSGALVVARVQAWKGPEVLCRALRLVPASLLPQVTWIGRDTRSAPLGGSLTTHLQEAYPDVWGPRVSAIGALPFEDVQKRIAGARLVIVPSEWDVFNIAAAEAMSAGRVVICSDAAGASDLIADAENGFLFRAGDAEALAGALVRAASLTDAEAAAVGSRARATVLARLSPALIAAGRVARFQALAAASRSRPAVPDWVHGFFRESGSTEAGLAFLDQVSLRDLSRYWRRRARGKVLGRLPSLRQRPT